MPKYDRAKPFDIIQEILGIKKKLAQVATQANAATTGVTAVTLSAVLDSNVADIQPSPGTPATGSSGVGVDAGHVHGQPPFFAPTGILGATQPARFIGSTSSGPPITGNFSVGDFVVSHDGNIYVCTTAGPPGTWTVGYLTLAGGTVNGAVTINGHVAIGLTSIQDIVVSGNITAAFGSVFINGAGSGLLIKEGTNARLGTVALVAGTATVGVTGVTAKTRIFLTSQADGGTPGWLRVSARTVGTSFTITSSSATDTSTVAYLLIEGQ